MLEGEDLCCRERGRREFPMEPRLEAYIHSCTYIYIYIYTYTSRLTIRPHGFKVDPHERGQQEGVFGEIPSSIADAHGV